MESGTYQIKFSREGVQIGHPETFTGFRLNAQHYALRKGRRSNADFVRVLDDGLEFWSERLDG
jgi:hypothetical protein